MRRPLSLRARLLVSHLLVVAVGVVVLLIAGRTLGDVLVTRHLRSMGHMMDAMAGPASFELEAGVKSALNRSLWWGAAASVLAASVVAGFASARLLRPIEAVRRVARRLASGSYHERVPRPAEPELAGLADDVNALAEALDTTEQARSRLISEVAHELRTPVATMKGYLEGLLDEVFQPDAETLAAMVAEAGRLERLAADLSSLSRTEEGIVDLHPRTIDLAHAVRMAASRLRPQFDVQDVALEFTATPNEIAVLADEDRVAQILTNLIGNALAYSNAEGRVAIRVSGDGVRATVEVSDNGRGLSPEQLSLVFERFYRADRSVGHGTGIGLTIARALARLQGGDVTVSSPGLGYGATFVLSLPRAKGSE